MQVDDGARGRVQGRRRHDSGYTLVELLVVLAVLAMLVAIATPRLMKYLSSSRIQTAHIQIQQLGAVLDTYKLELLHYPTTEQGLQALVEQPAGEPKWDGPYLKNKASLIDPWGNPYQYKSPGQHGEYDLYSWGADGREGGEGENGDITSW